MYRLSVLFVYLANGQDLDIWKSSRILIYKKTSMFISKVLTGYLQSISQLLAHSSSCRPRKRLQLGIMCEEEDNLLQLEIF